MKSNSSIDSFHDLTAITDKKLPSPHFCSVLVKKENGQMHFISGRGYETRNLSTIRLIEMANKKYYIPDFDWLIVDTGDRGVRHDYHGLKVLSYSSSSGDYKHVCPDFTFDHWRQVGIDDYESTCAEVSRNSINPPETEMLGWRGAKTHSNRERLTRLNDQINIDAKFIRWNRSNPNKLTCSNYVSLPDHPKRWRCLIDLEGAGWSARLKFLMFSRRVLFIADRPFKEWYFPRMVPWTHYVPCGRNLSDLIDNLHIIKSDPIIEHNICQASFDFAKTYLTRDACLARWSELLK